MRLLTPRTRLGLHRAAASARSASEILRLLPSRHPLVAFGPAVLSAFAVAATVAAGPLHAVAGPELGFGGCTADLMGVFGPVLDRYRVSEAEKWTLSRLPGGRDVLWDEAGIYTLHATALLTAVRDVAWGAGPSVRRLVKAQRWGDQVRLEPMSATAEGVAAHPAAVAALERRRAFQLADPSARRVLVFAGPPGTGKTVSAMWMAERLGTRCLRVPPATLAGSPAVLWAALEVLAPDVVIFDDVDRVETPEILDLFERLHTSTAPSTTILTANRVPDDTALWRPSRVDEIVRIDTVDPATIVQLLGRDPDARELTLSAAAAAELAARARAGVADEGRLLARAGCGLAVPDPAEKTNAWS